MFGRKCFDSFQFHYQRIIHKHICKILPYAKTIRIIHIQRLLSLNLVSCSD